MSRNRYGVASVLIVILLGAFSPLHQSPAQTSETDYEPPAHAPAADWIVPGSVSPETARRAVETRARLQSRNTALQREALLSLRNDLTPSNHDELRTATVPLVSELLDMEYRVLEFPRDYRIDSEMRLLALEVLGALGGAAARDQIRTTVREDSDGTLRASAALILAARPGVDPDQDLAVVSEALLTAVRRGGPESEVSRLLNAAEVLAGRVWNAEIPTYLEALVQIHQGRYSASLRRKAMSVLEELAER